MPRSKAFSGKQKKAQLQEKKMRKQGGGQFGGHTPAAAEEQEDADAEQGPSSTLVAKAGLAKPRDAADDGRNRYALKFRTETEESLKQSRKLGTKPIVPVQPEYLECQVSDFYTSELAFPIRPPWDYKLNPTELDAQERRYFARYLQQIESAHQDSMSSLSYFELNLETWRQFWRVLEMSDILLCIVDIRYPPLLFPPKLYEFASQELGKDIMLVLNKIDLAPAPLVLAWREYFRRSFPQLQVVCFTSYPAYNLRGNSSEEGKNKKKETMAKGKRTRGRMKMAAEGAMSLLQVCETLVGSQLDLGSWRQKIVAEMNEKGPQEAEEGTEIGAVIETTAAAAAPEVYKKFSGGILTIGCLGQPNVGKSSVINALMGRKVVSVSRTPGHTKHFQTIFLTPNVRLCDCPGLVFPSKVPKPLQVLCGSFPIAQLRDTIIVLRYLAERLNLPRMLQLNHPDGGGWNAGAWSAFDIAEGWAIKRGFFTAKASRPDSNRAANHILRMALDGRVCLCLTPPGYHKEEEEHGKWSRDPGVAEIEALQAKLKKKGKQEEESQSQESESESDSEEEEESSDAEEDKEADADADSDGDSDEEEAPKPKQKQSKVKKAPVTQLRNKFAMLEEADLE